MAKTPSPILNKSTSVLPWLVQYWLEVFHMWSLLWWGMFLLFLVSSRLLSWKDVKHLLSIYWNDHMISVLKFGVGLQLLICVYACISRIKSAWSCCLTIQCCWVQFASMLLRIFTSMVNREIYLQFSYILLISKWYWLCRMKSGAFLLIYGLV